MELNDPKINPRKYHFCPYCKKDLSIKLYGIDNTRHLVCPGGHVIYQSSAPTSSVLIIQDAEILLGKRGKEPRKGVWDTPGGFLNPYEDPETGAIREAKEELGVDTKIDHLIGVYVDTYGEEQEPTLNFYYQAHLLSKNIKPGSDTVVYGWFPWSNPPELAFRSEEQAVIDLRCLLSSTHPA